MGDTVKISLNENWVAISGLILHSNYSFQNINGESMYLRQQPVIPGAKDTGMELMPYRCATLVKEPNDIFVRMKSGNGVAYYGAFK